MPLRAPAHHTGVAALLRAPVRPTEWTLRPPLPARRPRQCHRHCLTLRSPLQAALRQRRAPLSRRALHCARRARCDRGGVAPGLVPLQQVPRLRASWPALSPRVVRTPAAARSALTAHCVYGGAVRAMARPCGSALAERGGLPAIRLHSPRPLPLPPLSRGLLRSLLPQEGRPTSLLHPHPRLPVASIAPRSPCCSPSGGPPRRLLLPRLLPPARTSAPSATSSATSPSRQPAAGATSSAASTSRSTSWLRMHARAAQRAGSRSSLTRTAWSSTRPQLRP